MKWKLLIFNLCLFAGMVQAQTDTVPQNHADTTAARRFKLEQVARARSRWAALFPSQVVVQNAGNMGVLSGGIGWSYGSQRQWETSLLVGWIPRHEARSTKLTMTLKQNYMPWSLALGSRCSVEPLRVGFYINAVFGEQFWSKQPHRYPDNYYSGNTRFKYNFCLGQQVTVKIDDHRSHTAYQSVSLFYEVSTCDTYIYCKSKNNSISWGDILGLSLGFVFQL